MYVYHSNEHNSEWFFFRGHWGNFVPVQISHILNIHIRIEIDIRICKIAERTIVDAEIYEKIEEKKKKILE